MLSPCFNTAGLGLLTIRAGRRLGGPPPLDQAPAIRLISVPAAADAEPRDFTDYEFPDYDGDAHDHRVA